ncbi:hypothetical protein, partial [Bradyrhizobium sp.]|uniref:hypothetical protein n=2 Tax=Bradyrhizobium sp. TaxID=376 RepID=UPI0025BC5B8F
PRRLPPRSRGASRTSKIAAHLDPDQTAARAHARQTFQTTQGEVAMPFDALIMSIAVVAVFVGFAGVLAWADSQTGASQRGRAETRDTSASQLRRRSF